MTTEHLANPFALVRNADPVLVALAVLLNLLAAGGDVLMARSDRRANRAADPALPLNPHR
jgi:hypothetical protein